MPMICGQGIVGEASRIAESSMDAASPMISMDFSKPSVAMSPSCKSCRDTRATNEAIWRDATCM
jgi:hypothetical protein